MVEVVAEPAERLRHQQARGDRVDDRGVAEPGDPAADVDAERAEQQGAQDGDAAVPGVPDRAGQERVPGVLARSEVVADVRRHVPGAGSDQAEDDGRDDDVDDDPRLGAAGRQPVVRDDERHDDARQDAQRVGVDLDRRVRRDPREHPCSQPVGIVIGTCQAGGGLGMVSGSTSTLRWEDGQNGRNGRNGRPAAGSKSSECDPERGLRPGARRPRRRVRPGP